MTDPLLSTEDVAARLGVSVRTARALARRHKHGAITHYDGCEEHHLGCLIAKLADEVERLRAERDEVLAGHSGAGSRREWASGSTWLYQGDAIVVIRAAAVPKAGGNR